MLQIAPIFLDCPSVIPISNEVAFLYVDEADGLLALCLDTGEVEMQTLIKNRVFLLRNSQTCKLEGNLLIGYIVQFKQVLMDHFLLQDVAQRNVGLFNLKKSIPFKDVSANGVIFLKSLISQLTAELDSGTGIENFEHYLFLLFRHANRDAKPSAPSLESGKMAIKMATYIETYFRSERSTSFYAGLLGKTERGLNAFSYKVYGRRFFKVLLDRLLCEAEILLADPDVPIKEIAYELGFSTYSHLNTYFMRHKGISPTAYRKKALSAKDVSAGDE